MKEIIKHADGKKFPYIRLTYYDFVGIAHWNKDVFIHNLPCKDHNEYFKEELEHKYSWNFYAVKRFKKRFHGLVIAKKIVRMFLEMLMHDLVYENDIYWFPRNGARLFVGAKDNHHRKSYKYNPETGGMDYALMVKFSKDYLRVLNHNPYYVKATLRWRERIEAHSKKFQYIKAWQS